MDISKLEMKRPCSDSYVMQGSFENDGVNYFVWRYPENPQLYIFPV